MSAFEKRVLRIEAKFRKAGLTPGTSIGRSLLDLRLFKEEGLKPKPEHKGRECALVWCVGLGPLSMPKTFGYGFTLDEALKNAARKRKPSGLKTLFVP